MKNPPNTMKAQYSQASNDAGGVTSLVQDITPNTEAGSIGPSLYPASGMVFTVAPWGETETTLQSRNRLVHPSRWQPPSWLSVSTAKPFVLPVPFVPEPQVPSPSTHRK